MSNSPHMLALPLPARSTLSPAARPGHAVRFASPVLRAVLLLCSLPLSLACGQTGSPFSQLPSGLIAERWNGNPAGYPAGFPASPGDATPCMQWDASAPGGGAWVGSPLPLPEGTLLKDSDMSGYRPLRGGSGTTVRASYFTGSCDNSGQTNGIMEQRCPAQQQSGVLPIQITLPMARYAGPVDGNGYLKTVEAASLIDRDGLIAPNATIRLQFRNKGYENTLPYIGGWPQGAIVKFNGVICNVVDGDSAPEPLGNNGLVLPTARRWRTATFSCPVRAVKFPELGPPAGSLTPRPNLLEVDFSGLPTGPNGQLPNFCLLVADAELSVKVYSPLVLVHGIGDNADSWDARDFCAVLDEHFIHYERVNFGAANTQQPGNVTKLAALTRVLSRMNARTGATNVGFVCHSLGGLDTLAGLSGGISFLRLSNENNVGVRPTLYMTLGTPYNGSPLASLIMAVRDAYTSPPIASTYWESVDGQVSGTAAWVAFNRVADVFQSASSFPTGWRFLTPGDASRFSASAASRIIARRGSVYGVAVGADADRNGDGVIQTSSFNALDEGASLAGSGMASWFVGLEPGLIVSPALTNAYKLVCSNAKFDVQIKLEETDLSENVTSIRKRVLLTTRFSDQVRDADIIVHGSSSRGSGSVQGLLVASTSWSGSQDGRNHTNIRDQRAAEAVILNLGNADRLLGELQ